MNKAEAVMMVGMSISFLGIGLIILGLGLYLLTEALDHFAERSYARRKLKAWGDVAIDQAKGRHAFERLCDEIRDSAAKHGL